VHSYINASYQTTTDLHFGEKEFGCKICLYFNADFCLHSNTWSGGARSWMSAVSAVMYCYSIFGAVSEDWTMIEQICQWELTYIHTCRPTSTCRAIFRERRISNVTFVMCLPLGNSTAFLVCLLLWNPTSWWLADSSDFGLLGSNVPQNGRFPAQDAHEPPCKIWRR